MASSIDFLEKLKAEFDLSEVDIRTYSPLSLAYIGDCVYDLVIRSMVLLKGNTSNNMLHKECVKYVSAVSQSQMADKLLPLLTEEELSIYKRGKNAKPTSKAKNATAKEYLKATGVEALVGYLFLSNRLDRIIELIKIGISDE